MQAPPGQTLSEKILSARAGSPLRAGDFAVCDFDLALGTDAAAPMAIDTFHQMNGDRVARPGRFLFALDHYAPPSTRQAAEFHSITRDFAARHGIDLHETGAGISHQIATESGRVVPGDLVIGADSHTVTCGALGAFATGVGSSDLAAALLRGRVWLRVPETIRVNLTGALAAGVTAKDAALALARRLGSSGANYRAIEYHGPGAGGLDIDGRMTLANLAVESGAKAAIFPADDVTARYLRGRAVRAFEPLLPDADARYAESIDFDLSRIEPTVALPHDPANAVPISQAPDVPIAMVFLGTCTGGRASDFRLALRVLEAAGGPAPGVQLVVTPASRAVHQDLLADGTLARFDALGATITTAGCGPCCGTSGPIPGDGVNVLSTANRNFKARMGNPAASIYLASPATCAASAAAGRIADPRPIVS